MPIKRLFTEETERIMTKRLATFMILLSILIYPQLACSKVYIDITSPSARKVPLAIVELVALEEEGSKRDGFFEVKKEIEQTLEDDLEFSGFFELVDGSFHPEEPSLKGLHTQNIPFSMWRATGTELIVKGGLKVKEDVLVAEFRLFDVLDEVMIFGKRYVAGKGSARRLAHAFADDLVEKLTGKRGVFSTKLLFVSDATGRKQIYISDYDGKNVVRLTRNRSINISPRWLPDGKSFSYTSYMKGYPCVYQQVLRTGKLKTIACRNGINIGGGWSPDGRYLALTMKGKKSPELFLFDSKTGRLTQLTSNYAIDVSPSWSPDGRKLVYVSDMAGKPQIYVLDLVDKKPRRITFEGNYNTSPVWSPDGRSILYVRREDSRFNIWLMDIKTGIHRQLTFEGDNLEPSWSPDGRYIVYEHKDRRGRAYLYLMRRDGSGKRRLDPTKGNESAPSWSPFR